MTKRLCQKVAIIGGNGFIGRHVVRRFLNEGAELCIVDIVEGPSEFSDIKQFKTSIENTTQLGAAVSGCNTVIFLAANSLPGEQAPSLATEVHSHVERCVRAAETCAEQGVRRLVFASSGGTVYGYSSEPPINENMPTFPINAYGVSKLSIENNLRVLARQSGMETVSLRVSNPYGEGQLSTRTQGFIAAAMKAASTGAVLPIWGDGSVERDFIYVDDVVSAFLEASIVPEPPDVANIGSGKAYSLLEVIQLIEPLFHRKLNVSFEPSRKVDVGRNILDIRRASDCLNWIPEVPLEEGLRRTANWWLRTPAYSHSNDV